MANEPIRLLFVIGSMGGGGAERCTIDLLDRLDRSRFAPQLYLAYRSGELLPEVPADVPVHSFVDGPVETSVSQRMAAKLRLLSEARAWQLRRVIRAERIDLVFSWGVRLAYETALAARFAPVPRIAYCVAEPKVELEIDFTAPTPWRWRLARWAYSSADRVYANAEGVRQRLLELYGLPPEQVELFRNLRDFSRLDRQVDAFMPQWPADGLRIVTVGRLHFQKGHAVLLQALAELVHQKGRPAQLIIVGQGPEEAALRRQVEELKLADRVAFAGFHPNPAPFYRNADLFVMPSLTEGLPNVLIEAVALGTPSISADCPTGPREILEDGRYGMLVPPGDAHALAQAIEQTLDHLAEIQAAMPAAQAAMRAKYDVGLGVRDFEERLLTVIRTSPHRKRRK